jgi:hypothetical protein
MLAIREILARYKRALREGDQISKGRLEPLAIGKKHPFFALSFSLKNRFFLKTRLNAQISRFDPTDVETYQKAPKTPYNAN